MLWMGQLWIRGPSTPSLGFIICWNDSQNSETLTFTGLIKKCITEDAEEQQMGETDAMLCDQRAQSFHALFWCAAFLALPFF